MPNLNVTNIPPPRVTFIDERTGLISREWYRWLLNIFQLTGSGSSVITLEDLQLSPSPSALTNDVVGAPLQSLSMQVGVAPPPPQLGTIASYNSDSMVAGAVAYSDGISYKMSGLGTVGQVLTSNGTAAPTWTTVGGTGTVTSVSVTSANGLAGTVTNPTTTPAISLSTTVNGIVQGNGTSLSAVTIGSGLSYAAGTLSATGGGSGTVTSVSGTGTVNGLTLTGTVTTSGNLTLGGTLDLSSPPAIGGTAPAAGAFTTVTASASTSASANVGAIRYGTLGYSDTDILASFATTSTGYAQMVLQNKSAGTAASTNFNVSNDAGTATTNYGELGINSSAFTGTGAFSAAGNVYLASASTDLAIGTYGANAIHFVVNSGATDAATISSAGLLTANNFASSSAAITGGTINGTVIGGTTAAAGTFTTINGNSALTVTNGAHSISSVNNTITITGGGASGLVNITSVGAGAMNGIVIGGTTPLAGTFTALSATSRTATGVLATSAGQTANVTIANTVTYTTGGKTLATQTAASGSAWRVRAFGTFTAANSATARNAQVACFWGTTQLTAVTSTVLTATAQTTNFEAEFVLTGSSTTAIWTTGYFLNRTNSATALAMNNVTPASTTVTSGAQTLDLRFSMSVSVAGDSWSIQAVTLERLQ